ncbi:MAG TPA: hypothetical protein DD730_12910 [Desulfosporosinus sp.]|nr:hypothetical protein [Desulfosporosinus sp.]
MNIILGPPGTGKTTTLLNIMEGALSSGMDPKKIGFISFTKRAIKEARDRVKVKFNLTAIQVQNFRTLHSFAFRHLGLSTRNLMTKKNFQEFADVMGIELTGIDVEENLEDIETVVFEEGDRLLFLDGVARNTQKTIEETWEKYGGELDFHEVNRVHIGLQLYKQQFAIMDYTDILERFLTEDFHISFDLLLIDEAQDLSTLQWRVLERVISKAKEVHIAGDDDQAIFRWAGADIEHFINLQGNVQVLDHSYRLPKEIHDYAKTILTNIGFRRDKVFNSASHSGSVSHITDLDELDFNKDTWLILARSAYSLFPHISFARSIGLFYSFKERGPNISLFCRAIQLYYKLQRTLILDDQEFKIVTQFMTQPFIREQPWYDALNTMSPEHRLWFRTLEEAGENLSKTPRVQFSTIHGAKGAEADNVVICPDVSYKAYKEMQDNPDDEARVFYVGVTRAKKNLYLLTPKTRYYYEL